MTVITGQTPPASLRERKKAATRKAIHEVAIRLVTELGTDGVTVEAICAGADVSQRTFFNYYPTKLAAAFDLLGAEISAEAREHFLAANQDLISDVCELVAQSVSIPADYPKLKAMLQERPQLAFSFWQQMGARRQPVIDLIEERTGDRHTAELAFSLVAIATKSAICRPNADAKPEEIVERLKSELAAISELIPHPGS
jgi:AcrR family transcriptional regulator